MTAKRNRVIFLVDMQSFYASVEKAAQPVYKDRPLIVAGDPARRSGIVLAACPLAKRFGVTTAEWVGDAVRKCPDLVVVRPHMQRYIEVSMQITSLLEQFTDLVEPYSIDEQFCDITPTMHLFGTPEQIAARVQQSIMEATQVYARVGIGENKVLAKMACDNFAKKNADGIFWLRKAELEEHLWQLPVDKAFGIGSRMRRNLNKLGIYTIGDLAKTPLGELRRKWGINGEVLWRTANGLDDSPVTVETHAGQQGIGHQMTLPRDFRLKSEIDTVLLELSEEVCRRSRRSGMMGRTLTVGCSGADFDHPTGFWRQTTLSDPTNVTNVVYPAAVALFHQFWDGEPVRRLGLSLTQLVRDEPVQLALFDDSEKLRRLEKATDFLKEKFGSTAILRAASLTAAGQARERSAKIGGHYK